MIDLFKFGFLAVCSGIIFSFGYLSGKLDRKANNTCDSCKHLISKGKKGLSGDINAAMSLWALKSQKIIVLITKAGVK